MGKVSEKIKQRARGAKALRGILRNDPIEKPVPVTAQKTSEHAAGLEKVSGQMSSASDYLKSLSPTSSIPTAPVGQVRRSVTGSVSDFGIDSAVDKVSEDHDNLPIQRGIASGLKNLYGRGALTSDLLKEARGRASAAGVSEDQFSSFLGKNNIKQQNFAGSPASPTSASSGEATENVLSARTGLASLTAMQDDNYELGSGSPLSAPSRPIGPASGRARSAARRLRRKGYGKAAEQMSMAGEMAAISEPPIDSEYLKKQRDLDRAAAAREANRHQDLSDRQVKEFHSQQQKRKQSITK